MSEKQRLKHIADKQPQPLTEGSELDVAATTPDGLGPWNGGPVELKGSNRWVAEKSHAQRTADSKNTPGLDYASKITHRQERDFAVIHMGEDGVPMLYNVKTDAWDIKGDTADIPYYSNEAGLWDYNVKTGLWDVPVAEVYFDAESIERNTVQELSNVNP